MSDWFNEDGSTGDGFPSEGPGGIQHLDSAMGVLGTNLIAIDVIIGLMESVHGFAEKCQAMEAVWDKDSEKYATASRFMTNAEDAIESASQLRKDLQYTQSALIDLATS